MVGDGTAPNISGTYDTGSYTAHGYANAALGPTLKSWFLIRKIMAVWRAAGYPADAIVLNPADWATIEISCLPLLPARPCIRSTKPARRVCSASR